MSSKANPLSPRGHVLEEEFFRQREADMLAKMRASQEKETSRQQLQAASNIRDEALLDKLVELGVQAETVAALALVPLIRVAWASGSVDDKEEAAILKAAGDHGITSASHDLLRSWLSHEPDDALVAAWREYTGALIAQLDDTQRAALKEQVLGNARRVAASSGGLLGIGAISKEEERVLQELEAAFA